MAANKTLGKIAIATFLTCASNGFSEEVLVLTPQGGNMVFDIDPAEPFFNVVDRIGSTFAAAEGTESGLQIPRYSLNYELDADEKASPSKTAKGSHHRRYENEVSSKDKKIITYIVTTVDKKNLASLMLEKSSLDKAHDKINSIHPLRFLMCIFTDEKLKSAMKGIYDSSIKWSFFKNGLFGALSEEFDRNNLHAEYVLDFAQSVGVSYDLIYPSVQEANWKSLMSTLIHQVPRSKK